MNFVVITLLSCASCFLATLLASCSIFLIVGFLLLIYLTTQFQLYSYLFIFLSFYPFVFLSFIYLLLFIYIILFIQIFCYRFIPCAENTSRDQLKDSPDSVSSLLCL